jgi:hypothetical protein
MLIQELIILCLVLKTSVNEPVFWAMTTLNFEPHIDVYSRPMPTAVLPNAVLVVCT